MRETLGMRRGQGVGALATWSIRDIVIGLLLAVLAVVFLQLIFIGPALAAGYDSDDTLVFGLAILSTLIWNLLLVGIVLGLARRSGGDWTSLGWRAPWPNQPWPVTKVLAIVAVGLMTMWFIQGIYVGIVNALGLQDLLPDQQFPEGMFDEWWLVVLVGLAVVIGAPIAEEIFFRGFVFGGLRRRLSVLPPALMTGALFSVAHLQLGLLIPFSLIGLVLSIVYERTGSIRFNIALHMIFNTASFLALVFVPGARDS